MKINFKGEKRIEDMYKVGNVIKDSTDTLYLVVEDSSEDEYALVNLTDNRVTNKYATLEELVDEYADEDDVLVNAEINVL